MKFVLSLLMLFISMSGFADVFITKAHTLREFSDDERAEVVGLDKATALNAINDKRAYMNVHSSQCGIAFNISDCYIDTNNDTRVNFELVNCSEKAIGKITIEFVVNDKIKKRATLNKVIKGIPCDEPSSFDCYYEHISKSKKLYNIYKIEIFSFTITYVDGTVKSLSPYDISRAVSFVAYPYWKHSMQNPLNPLN